jgi:hypothetical protein
MLVPPNVFADSPFAGFFKNFQAAIRPPVSPRLSTSRINGSAFHYRPEIAKPLESSIKIVHRRPNTITVLFEKQNIMLSSEFRSSMTSLTRMPLTGVESNRCLLIASESQGYVAHAVSISHGHLRSVG